MEFLHGRQLIRDRLEGAFPVPGRDLYSLAQLRRIINHPLPLLGQTMKLRVLELHVFTNVSMRARAKMKKKNKLNGESSD